MSEAQFDPERLRELQRQARHSSYGGARDNLFAYLWSHVDEILQETADLAAARERIRELESSDAMHCPGCYGGERCAR